MYTKLYHFQEAANDVANVDELEKELAEIVIDAPPVILAEVCWFNFVLLNKDSSQFMFTINTGPWHSSRGSTQRNIRGRGDSNFQSMENIKLILSFEGGPTPSTQKPKEEEERRQKEIEKEGEI